MSAARDADVLSVEDYFALEATQPDNRYEYLDGHLYMISGGSRNHARISANIIQALRETPCADSHPMRVSSQTRPAMSILM